MKSIAILLFIFTFISCNKKNFLECDDVPSHKTAPEKVMIVYLAGDNNLSPFLKNNYRNLTSESTYIPMKCSKNILLVYSKFKSNSNTSSLKRIYKDRKGNIIQKTLKEYPSDVIASSSKTLKDVLIEAKNRFNANHYGLVIGTHGTGWLPAGYYDKAYKVQPSNIITTSKKGSTLDYPIEGDYQPIEGPIVRSIGDDDVLKDGTHYHYQISLENFANAIPYKLDYIVFDLCFGAGIEMVAQLSDKTKYILGSPAEILGDGDIRYHDVAKQLLEKDSPDLKAVCDSAYEFYNTKSGAYRSVTLSLIDCSKYQEVSKICKDLFEKYRANIQSVRYNSIQKFYRNNRHWFYDLKDILVKSGISQEDQTMLDEAIKKCVIYKKHTPYFMQGSDGFAIQTYCGLTMYLPNHGDNYLNNKYKELEWNKQTLLVK